MHAMYCRCVALCRDCVKLVISELRSTVYVATPTTAQVTMTSATRLAMSRAVRLPWSRERHGRAIALLSI